MKGLSLEFANKLNMYLPFLTQSSNVFSLLSMYETCLCHEKKKSINVAKTNLIIFLFTWHFTLIWWQAEEADSEEGTKNSSCTKISMTDRSLAKMITFVSLL